MNRKGFLRSLGLMAGGIAMAFTGLGSVMGQSLGTGSRRGVIAYVLRRIGVMTPEQLERALFESGLSEPFDLGAELAAMVREGELAQSVSADGLVYKLTESSPADGAGTGAFDERMDELKGRFEAERDYIAQYTESSTGVVPVFLSIRRGAAILMKVNLIVPDVTTARVVTRNWMKNAHRTHEAVWESVGEGLPFPKI